MNHADHVRLIRQGIAEGIPRSKRDRQMWADFGSGEGAFTLALRDVAGPEVEIYSIDKDSTNLERQKEAFEEMFPDTKIHYLRADFAKPLDLPQLDGVLAANSIHFVKDRVMILKRLKTYLKPKGKLVIVEYNVDVGNTWVLYPFSFTTFQKFALDAGFSKPSLLETESSRFLNEIYSAVAMTN